MSSLLVKTWAQGSFDFGMATEAALAWPVGGHLAVPHIPITPLSEPETVIALPRGERDSESQATNDGPGCTPVRAVVSEQDGIQVEFTRLEMGGDIENSYSADIIGDHRGRSAVMRPFKHAGKLYVSTGGASCGEYRESWAYELVSEEQFPGQSLPYAEKTRDSEAARNDPNGFYHGVQVSWQKKPHVLKGPKLLFVARKPDGGGERKMLPVNEE